MGLPIGAVWHNTDVNQRIAYLQSEQGLNPGSTARRLSLNPDGGNVGIGTTSPATKLAIVDTDGSITFGNSSSDEHKLSWNEGSIIVEADPANLNSSSSIQFKVDASERMRIDNSGNVGIGTTSPGALLNLQSTTSASLRIKNTTNNTPSVPHIELLNNNNEGLGITINRSGVDSRAKFSADTAISVETNGSERLRIDSSGNVGIGATPGNDEQLLVHGGDNSIYVPIARSDSKWITIHSGGTDPAIFCDTGGAIRFGHGSSRNAFSTERMRIDSSGNVGIGTTSPGGTLHVDASGGATVRVSRISANASKYGQLEHDGTNTTLTSTDNLLFNVNSSERMRIDSSGNVGIGTTSPSAQIHLNQSGTSSYSTLKLSNSGASGRTYEIGVGGSTTGSGYAGNLYFYDSTASARRAVIDSSGDVEIGGAKYLTWVSSFGGTHRGRISCFNNDSIVFENGSGNSLHIYTSPSRRD